jgi:hemerythrin-like domain-containing protein
MFDHPLEILTLCHEKVRRFALLTDKLQTHVAQHGADDAAAQAAQKVLRYFNIAAPLHHDDEDLDVYPALLALTEDRFQGAQKTVLAAAIHRLQNEHTELARLWTDARQWLVQIEQKQSVTPPATLKQFIQAYPHHADCEEAEIYPFIELLEPHTLQVIGQRMAQRRGAKHT